MTSAQEGILPAILVVEDDVSILNLLADFLRASGYTVLAATGGPEALSVADQHTSEIHLLITDVVLKSMDGRSLATRLLQTHPRMKIIFMSGHTQKTLKHRGIDSDREHFLQKPFSLALLTKKVNEVMTEQEN